MIGPHELELQVRETPEAALLGVRGALTMRSSALELRPVLRKLVLDRGRLLVDLDGLTLLSSPALTVFPSVLAAAGGWPSARMVLFGADGEVAATIAARRTAASVPVAADLAHAHVLLQHRPERIRRTSKLPGTPDAAALTRALIRTACADWGLDAVVTQAAVVVGNEFVTNAVLHAGGPNRLVLTDDARGLTVAVSDGRPAAPALTRLSDHGYGLRLVEASSAAWGVTPAGQGKTVWALLRPTVRRIGPTR
jgi:hypothetical protein